MTNRIVTFNRPGVLVREGTRDVSAVRDATASSGMVTTTLTDGSLVEYMTTDIVGDQRTGTLTFTSDSEKYRLRDLREPDGLWLSRYKMVLPYTALTYLIEQESAETTVTESLQAFAAEDSAYIVGLSYRVGDKKYYRTGGSWVEVDPQDKTYSGEGMIGIAIDPEKSESFIDLYDRNYVTVTDTEKYEEAESDPSGPADGEDGFVPNDENAAGGPADAPLDPVEQDDEEPEEAEEEADQPQE